MPPPPDLIGHDPIDIASVGPIHARRERVAVDVHALAGGLRRTRIGRLPDGFGAGIGGTVGIDGPLNPLGRGGFTPGPGVDDPQPPLDPGHASIVVNGNPERNRPMLHVVDGEIVNPKKVKHSMRVEATAAVDWVCKIIDPNRASNRATGLLVADNLIMTNHHVLAALGAGLPSVEAWFGWDATDDQRETVTFTGEVPFQDPQLDVALLVIERTPDRARVAVLDATGAPAKGAKILVVGYPDQASGVAGHASASAPGEALGRPALVGRKRISAGKVVATGAHVLVHDCSTTNGSSGSPVVDADDRVVGLHSGATTWNQQFFNRATPMGVILEATSAANIDLTPADNDSDSDTDNEPQVVDAATGRGDIPC